VVVRGRFFLYAVASPEPDPSLLKPSLGLPRLASEGVEPADDGPCRFVSELGEDGGLFLSCCRITTRLLPSSSSRRMSAHDLTVLAPPGLVGGRSRSRPAPLGATGRTRPGVGAPHSGLGVCVRHDSCLGRMGRPGAGRPRVVRARRQEAGPGGPGRASGHCLSSWPPRRPTVRRAGAYFCRDAKAPERSSPGGGDSSGGPGRRTRRRWPPGGAHPGTARPPEAWTASFAPRTSGKKVGSVRSVAVSFRAGRARPPWPGPAASTRAIASARGPRCSHRRPVPTRPAGRHRRRGFPLLAATGCPCFADATLLCPSAWRGRPPRRGWDDAAPECLLQLGKEVLSLHPPNLTDALSTGGRPSSWQTAGGTVKGCCTNSATTSSPGR